MRILNASYEPNAKPNTIRGFRNVVFSPDSPSLIPCSVNIQEAFDRLNSHDRCTARAARLNSQLRSSLPRSCMQRRSPNIQAQYRKSLPFRFSTLALREIISRASHLFVCREMIGNKQRNAHSEEEGGISAFRQRRENYQRGKMPL